MKNSDNVLFIFVFYLLFFNGNFQDFGIVSDDDSDSSSIDDFNIQTSYIEKGFVNSKSFVCPRVKELLKTGTTVKDLAPEDISIVATMGDAIATGVGLYPVADVEFRGAVFTTGGDSNVDGLPTIANILLEFNPLLKGISHGMGSVNQLPAHQLNLAHSGAETDYMPDQARELIRRLYWMNTTDSTMDLNNEWVMIFVTIGTEELCAKCDEPNINALKTALLTLRKGIPRALIVLIGPVHVTKNTALTYNLLKPRCSCLSRISDRKLRIIQKRWKDAFRNLEDEFNRREYPNFEILALPSLEIVSRYPETLFISEKPLLNRKGHAYAAKWLWNRMIAGPKYNASKMQLSEDAYYCPSLGCPYFRTSGNHQHCSTITIHEYNRIMATTLKPGHLVTHNAKKETIQSHIFSYMSVIIFLSTISVFVSGTIFYCHGLKEKRGRFEHIQGV